MYLHGTFKNKNNDTIEVQIRNSKGIQEIVIGEDHNSEVFFSDDPVEISLEADDLFQTVLKKSCTINLVTSIFLGDKVFAGNAEDVTVKVFKNNILIFSGFVEPNTYTQPYAYHLEEFSLNCIDYLTALQYKYLTDSRTYSNLLADSNIYSFTEYLDTLLGSFGNVLYDKSKTVGNQSALDICGISLNVFLGDSEDDLMSNEEILTELLQYLNLHIVQEGENFFIFDWKSVESGSITWHKVVGNNATIPLHNYNVVKEMYSSDSTTLSMSEVYNQIQVKCDLDEVDEVLSSPLDSDLLDSHFDRSQLYMTEFWNYGLDAGEFKKLVTSPMTTDPESVNAVTEADTWGARDWYVKWLYNPSWTLTYHNEDVEDYLHVVNGVYLDQHLIMKALIDRKMFPALVRISSQKEGMSKTKNKRVNSSLTSTDYLVISVNGNGVDTDEEATNIDNANSYACGTDGLFSFTSGKSASFSPSSSQVKNYLVFNGKMVLAPRMPRSGYNGNVEEAFTITFKELQDKINNGTFNGNSLFSSNLIGYKDGVAYYTQEFWTASRTSSTPRPDKETNYMYPFLNVDNLRQYEYNYSSDGGSTVDTYDKIPILECEMKIGDKYLVENTYNINGKPTYSWLRLEQCPYLRDDDGNVTNVRKTTFTLGFDPEIGDFIIGKEYELANTVDGRISDEIGTAIPITASDALSGQVEFKIKGLVNVTWNNITRRHPTLFRHTKFYNNYVNLLSHVSAIWIKDFGVKLISDNSGMDVKKQSKDLIYISDETHSYIKKKDDIEFKINTMPTVEEAVELGVKSTVSTTNVINMDTNMALVSITDNQGNTDRPEKIYVDQYWNYYNSPKVLLETEFHNTNDYTIFDTFTFNGFGKMLTTSITQNIKDNNVHIICRQL